MSFPLSTAPEPWRLSTRRYWALRRFSWLLQLVGMAAGGWFGVRAMVVWGVGGYPLEADVFVSAGVLVLWAAGVVLLLRPPAGARATVERPTGDGRAVVWQLGRRFRGWNVLLAPIGGLLVLLLTVAVVRLLGIDATLPPPSPWLGVPLGIVMVATTLALVGIVVRSGLLGIELTETEMVVRGYVRTRRIPRDRVVDARPNGMSPLAELLSTWAMNRRVDSALTVSLSDGSRLSLPVTHSSYPDLAEGAAIIRVWCGATTAAEVEARQRRGRATHRTE